MAGTINHGGPATDHDVWRACPIGNEKCQEERVWLERRAETLENLGLDRSDAQSVAEAEWKPVPEVRPR